MFYQVSLFDDPQKEECEPINSRTIVQQYLENLSDKTAKNDVTNAVVRYFIPSIGGPISAARKRCRISLEEVESAFQYLKNVSLEMLASSPEMTIQSIQDLGLSKAQLIRIQRSLRELVAWSRAQDLLPISSIPQKYYKTIEIGKFDNLRLKRGNLKTIYESYAQELASEEDQNDLTNAILRYFVPATGGPLPVHKPAFPEEVYAGLKHLETLPREYFAEAPNIATESLEALEMSLTQSTRVRASLRGLIDWAISKNYLPDPNKLAPWGEVYDPPLLLPTRTTIAEEIPSVQQIYDEYRKQLDDSKVISNLQWVVIRYFVPACGGPKVCGKRASTQEIQAALSYLDEITIDQLFDAVRLTETQFDRAQLAANARTAGRSALRQLLEWSNERGYLDSIQENSEPVVQLRTFRTPGQRMERKKPGQQLHENRCPDHALGVFPDDYINPRLEQQIAEFQNWRRKNNVAEGTIKHEHPQILQVMGWLHRYEGVPLKRLRFEKLLSKSKLRWSVKKYRSYEKYLWAKTQGQEDAIMRAAQDKKRIERYLDFVGGHPGSKCKRIALLIAIAKFIYRDLLGSIDYSHARSLPILVHLLDLQKREKKKDELKPATIPYGETSTNWEGAVLAMEMQRRRADKFVLEIGSSKSAKGYTLQRRPDTAMANELQKFLSIAFLVAVFPSRSRTYYELRIGETFKEGIDPGRNFIPKSKFESFGIKDDAKFYFHHLPSDYKTGKAMTAEVLENNGWWVEIPNIVFLDGQYLYDYIRRWLDWGREIKEPIKHNFFFRQCQSTQPVNGQDWKSRIKNITERWTAIPIPTSSLRKMWSSYLAKQNASYAVRKAAHELLQHSEEVHEQNYDQHPTVDQTRPALEFNQTIISQVLQGYE